MRHPDTTTPHVVIVGAGFGGLAVAHGLSGSDVRITLIDQRNHHLFQPLLYQVGTASLATSEIAWPIRHLVRKRKEIVTLLSVVTGVDTAARHVQMEDGTTVRLRHVGARHRRAARIFRSRRMGTLRSRTQDPRRRDVDTAAHSPVAGARGARNRRRAPDRAAHLRGRRRRPHRRGARRQHRGARTPEFAGGFSADRHAQGARAADRGRTTHPAELHAGPVGLCARRARKNSASRCSSALR